MNFTLYPIYWLADKVDDEQFDLGKPPFDVAEGVRIEEVSGRFAKGTFDFFKERMGTARLEDLNRVEYALVHVYPDPDGFSQVERSEEMVRMLAACLRLIRPMRQAVQLMRGRVRDEDRTFDVREGRDSRSSGNIVL